MKALQTIGNALQTGCGAAYLYYSFTLTTAQLGGFWQASYCTLFAWALVIDGAKFLFKEESS